MKYKLTALTPILQYSCDKELPEYQIILSILPNHLGLLGNIVIIDHAAEHADAYIEHLGGVICTQSQATYRPC